MTSALPTRPRWLRPSRTWPSLCLVLAMASLLVWIAGLPATGADLAHHPLAWQSDHWVGRPWTIWTSAFVHATPGHLLANLLALAAVAVLGVALDASRLACLALLLAWPMGTECLVLWPRITHYGGLSGLIHAAAGVLFVLSAIEKKATPIPQVLGAALAFKIATEHAWAVPVAFDPAWGFNVVVAAHLSHTAAAVACAGLVWFLARLRARALNQALADRIRASKAVVE